MLSESLPFLLHVKTYLYLVLFGINPLNTCTKIKTCWIPQLVKIITIKWILVMSCKKNTRTKKGMVSLIANCILNFSDCDIKIFMKW